MESRSLLPRYERALDLTREMLDAAQKGDWDALVQREQERSLLIDRLKQDDPDPASDAASRSRKRELIAAMLQLDEQIQVLTQDWMHELREVLDSVDAAPRLNRP